MKRYYWKVSTQSFHGNLYSFGGTFLQKLIEITLRTSKKIAMSTLKINVNSWWKAFVVLAISIVLASPTASAQSPSQVENLKEAEAL